MPKPQLATPYRSERDALGKRASQFRPYSGNSNGPKPGILVALDTFAGAGGFSTALLRTATQHGMTLDLTIINHWSVALDNARQNLGNVTVINSAIQDVRPLDAIPGGYVDIMLAAPECIFFSSARGARPINDQRRSTASEVLRFLEELDVQTLILENVQELRDWGMLDKHHRPIKERKGEYFHAFVKAIKNLGYDVAFDTLVAADYGDATTRKRLYLVAQKRTRARLPRQTHSKDARIPDTLPWVPARNIIDFAVKGSSIFSRTVPHAAKTLRRVGIGFADQVTKTPLAAAYVQAVDRFKHVSEQYHAQIDALPSQKKLGRKLTKHERNHVRTVKARAQQQHRLLVEKIFLTPVAEMTWEDLLLHQSVEPMFDGESRIALGTIAPLEPVITKLYGTGTTQEITAPLDTVTAGGIDFGLARPIPETFLVTVNHGKTDNESSSRDSLIDDPLKTLTTKNSQGVVNPFLLRANASDTSAWDDSITPIDTPLRTVITKNNLSIVLPDATILPQNTYAADKTASPSEPVPTITTISRHGLVQAAARSIPTVEPFVDSFHGPIGGRDRAPRTLSLPLATQTTEPRFGLVDPLLIGHHHAGPNNVHENAGTATNEPAGFVAPASLFPEPVLIRRHIGFASRVAPNPSLDQPMVTATTDGAGYIAQPSATVIPASTANDPNSVEQIPHAEVAIAPVDPIIIPQQRGAGVDFDSLDRPLRTTQTKNGTGIAIPYPEGFITPNFGERQTQKPRVHHLSEPVPTATSHGAGMLVASGHAAIDPGKPYLIVSGTILSLDIMYRMLMWNELSKAMSLITDTDTYTFDKTASTSQRVKMIGNAVAVKTAMAIIAENLKDRFTAHAMRAS